MKVYDLEEEQFEEFKCHCVKAAEAGNFWWRKGFPAIAEKLMEANLMMLEEMVHPANEDKVSKQGLLDTLHRIRVQLGKEYDEPAKARRPH